jgi:tryptophan-rich sensory protein
MPRHSKLSLALGLLAWLAITFVAAAVGSIASVNAATFYAQLAKPTWAPPAGVFGPVWSVLYLLMGIAAWLVWRQREVRAVKTALALFIAQLVANALWSWAFFGWHRGALAAGEVLVLLALVAATAATFWRARPLAGALLLHYLAWVSFASALTFAVWRANPGLL